MNAFELSQHIAARLQEDGLEYAIGGALALTAWAIPRDTHGVDISVSPPKQNCHACSTHSSEQE